MRFNVVNNIQRISLAVLFSLTTLTTANAHDERHQKDAELPCPVAYYNGVPMDEEFGAGAQEITHCAQNRKNAKVVIEVDYPFPYDAFGNVQTNKANFLSNIEKMIDNYEVVHGMTIGKDVHINVVFSSSSAILATTQHPLFAKANGGDPTNPFQALVNRGIEKGFNFYVCQMASRTLGINMSNKIEGVNFVPGGHMAVADFQLDGYALIRP
jgi:intracellular sulfur oxidation DsrE/DsrF family protein